MTSTQHTDSLPLNRAAWQADAGYKHDAQVLETARDEWVQLIGGIATAEAPLDLATDLALGAGRYVASISGGRAVVHGGRAKDVLHGVYALLESLGYVFTVRGPVAPDVPLRCLPEVALDQAAFLQRRGIRQHINFPMDISGYPLSEASEYIRNLARMKLTDIVFHLYDSCGWFQVTMPGYQACTRDGNPLPTFFYTERQLVPPEPQIARVIRNRKVFCPPEAEALYGTPDTAEFQRWFLSSLIDEARAFGLHVGLAAEPKVLDHISVGTFPNLPRDMDLMIRATLELVNQMVTCYPQADEYELISGENVPLPGDNPVDEARTELSRLLPDCPTPQREKWLSEVCDGVKKFPLPFWEPEQMLRTFPHTLQSLFVARETFGRAQAHPALGPRLSGKDLSIGLYNGAPGMTHAMAEIMHAAIPQQYGLCWIPAHGADRVNRNLERMELEPAAFKRLRIYTWAEVDGAMYSMQHPEQSLRENILRAGGGAEHQTRGLLVHHWRNAENELSLKAFALYAHRGATPEEFALYLSRDFWSTGDAPGVRRLLDDLEAFQDFHMSNNTSAGFCFYPCWLYKIESMEYAMGNDNDLEKALTWNDSLIKQVETLRSKSKRLVGIERLTTLRTFLEATHDHFHTRISLLKMRKLLLAQTQGGQERTAEERQAFQILANEALKAADTWMRTMSTAVVDRGVEGNLVSYAHVIKRYIRNCAGLHGTAKPLDDNFTPSVMDAPPLLS